jgi:hypothetical protein
MFCRYAPSPRSHPSLVDAHGGAGFVFLDYIAQLITVKVVLEWQNKNLNIIKLLLNGGHHVCHPN